jgi:hypothetical protein
MSEPRDDRTVYEDQYFRAAHTTAYVHITKDTVLELDSAHRDEDRVVLQLGDGAAETYLFLHAPDLERLHDLIHEAFADLGHSTPLQSSQEAYGNGWDDAVSWIERNLGEPIPANVPGGAA